MKNEELLTRREASEYLQIAEGTLANWASTKSQTIPMVKIGRLARYRKKDLDAYIESRVVNQPIDESPDV